MSEFDNILTPLLPDEEQKQMALAILTGTYIADFVGIGRVRIDLTDNERAEYLAAIIKSQGSFWPRSIAYYLSEDLEDLVCGHRPARYTMPIEEHLIV